MMCPYPLNLTPEQAAAFARFAADALALAALAVQA
jgi:hypothetical protein